MLRVKSPIFGLILLVSAIHFAGLTGCSTSERNSDTPEGAFAIAQEFDKDERYEEAIRRYGEVKTKFPYSKYATLAELATADAYFKQESFPEAQVSYQGFKELHPKHAQSDYVTYRLGLSFYEQLPESEDRDLTLAHSAILYFDEVLSQYPNSEYAKLAGEKRQESLRKLARKEIYIANFYFKREAYISALARYEGLLRTYPNVGYDAEALLRAAQSANRIGELDRAKVLAARLQSQFPETSEAKQVSEELKN